MKPNEQMAAYSEAVKSGLYAKKSGLVGKYDNVRRYWEDEITRHFLQPHLHQLIERTMDRMRRLRIMDLGCGSADGYELLTGIRDREASLHDLEVDMLTPEVLGVYRGVDLSTDLLDQAREIYGANPKMEFVQADFQTGVPLAEDEEPFDLYFASYGTWSHHNDDATAVALLADIARRTRNNALVVCDWLGRYSYEWQTLWSNDLSENRNMDYVVSYIYEKQEREAKRDELQHLWLRLMSRQEVDAIVSEASRESAVEIRVATTFDRSIFTGRHLDTQEYNPYAQPLRAAVNCLHEANVRTELGSLLIDYAPKSGFDFINRDFELMQMCWNTLIKYTDSLLATKVAEEQGGDWDPPPVPASYPAALRRSMNRMRRLVQGVGWLDAGLPRENIIEPQLGYALRSLMMGLQEGNGYGHGLTAVLEIEK